MEAFSRLTSMLLQALETREPTVDLLESFVEHWKAITNFYIQTTNECCPVKQTEIPWHLRQMLDILVYEEKQQGVEETGPCLEYLLQHKLLETLCTLGKAQCPPGMSQQVLLFSSKLLSQIQKPLLHLINIYRPVQKLIRLCGLPDSQAEREEAQFLLAVCSTIKQDPHVLRYVLELPDSDQSQQRKQNSNHKTESTPSSSQSLSPTSALDPASRPHHSRASAWSVGQSDCSISAAGAGLLVSLLQLTNSQRSSVSLKAYEGLLLLAGLQSGGSGEVLAEQSQLAELLVGRLVQLYSLLPLDSLEPGDIQSWPPTSWSSQFSRSTSDPSTQLPGSEHMNNFFSWFDFLDHLMREAPQVLAVKLAQCVHVSWLVSTLQLQLLHTSERDVLLATSMLCAAVRLVRSDALLDRLVRFLLGTQTQHEDTHTHTVTYLLLQHCDHISDQISMASLCVVEELLQKPHRDILNILVLRNLENRSYLLLPPAGLEDGHAESSEPAEDSDELEEDPFFLDSMLSAGQQLLSAPPPPTTLGSPADVVNSFLCLVPQQARSAALMQEGGYESYIHDAHTLVMECQSLCLSWDWPVSLPPPSSSAEGSEFFEGHLLKMLFDRLGRILEQPYELNLQLTSLLSRLCSFNHPTLHEYLLNPYINLSHCSRSLFSVLIRVIGELMQRIPQVPNLTDKLLDTRRQLMGLDNNTELEHLTLLRGVIVLEEFCKELAAIAFVKLPLDCH